MNCCKARVKIHLYQLSNFLLLGAAPIVTGISPAEGPPGTIVKIRGENLGTSAKDLKIVIICGQHCTYTAEWQHSRLIHARTSTGLGMGDIIVYTKSGGKGTSYVKFRGYVPRVGLLTEAAVWVDESRLFEDKPSSSLSNSRIYSTNVATYTDPLGVAPEETGAHINPDQIEEWYMGSTSNPLSEDFNASRFLLERHLDTSFDALKSGYYHLQSQDTRTSVGPTSFVRGNLDTILNSLGTLNEIRKQLSQHESETIGSNICKEMQDILSSCNLASFSLFKDILTRKDEADAKRNVLNVLHRYRFLFNLPRSIEKNIKQGEFEILISDYNRSKALFQNTEVKSFQKALAEVDQKIVLFSTQLKRKLFDFPLPLEEQKKIIRYLNDLDYPGDAGWECIVKQSQWIRSLLVNCQVLYKSKECFENLHTDIKRPLAGKNSLLKVPLMYTPQGLLMVEDLCKIISEHLTELWHLGQTYLSKQLGGARNPLGKLDNATDKFLDLVNEVITVFCEITESVLYPPEKKNIGLADSIDSDKIVAWLPEAVNTVRMTLDKMDSLITEQVITPLKNLASNSVADCVKMVLSSSVSKIQKLAGEEKWQLDSSHNLYSTSKLPYMFETIFLDSLKFVREFIRKHSKTEKEEKYECYLSPEYIVPTLKLMLQEFIITLEATVFIPADSEPSSADTKNKCTSKDVQILVLLSNCYHLKEIIIPRIMNQCVKFGYSELCYYQEDLNVLINRLSEQVFMAYIELKGEPIVGSIEVGINLGEYLWDTNQGNNSVRQYVRDILMKLVVIHDQVSSISNLFISRIFTVLVESISEELLRIYECIQSISREGSVQAFLELNVLLSSLENYVSDKARLNFQQSLEKIPFLCEDDKKKIGKMAKEFESSMHYQISSFSLHDKIVLDTT